MEDDIDIEEHDVMDNPRIKDIFPDLSKVKTEVKDDDNKIGKHAANIEIKKEVDITEDYQDYEDISIKESNEINSSKVSDRGISPKCYDASQKEISTSSKKTSTKNTLSQVHLRNTVNLTKNALVLGKRSNNLVKKSEVSSTPKQFKPKPTNKPLSVSNIDIITNKSKINSNKVDNNSVTNKIVLGSKPVKSPETDGKEYLPAFVALKDWGVILKASSRYCDLCEILFPTIHTFHTHKISVHSAFDASLKLEDSEESQHSQNTQISSLSTDKAVKTYKKRKLVNSDEESVSSSKTIRKSSKNITNSPKTISYDDDKVSGIQCYHCDNFFADNTELINHLYTILSDDDDDDNSVKIKNKSSPNCNFQCEICKENFSNDTLAKFHKRFMHPNETGNIIKTEAAKANKSNLDKTKPKPRVNKMPQIKSKNIIPTKDMKRVVTLYKCLNCKTCVVRKFSMSNHKCTIDCYKKFCKVCQQWFAYNNWNQHSGIHKGGKLKIVIKTFKPKVVVYSNIVIRKQLKLKADKDGEKININDKTAEYENDKEIDIINNEDTTSDEEINTNSELMLCKCSICKVCIFNGNNTKKHKCVIPSRNKFCHICQQTYSCAKFKFHLRTFCRSINKNTKITLFTPGVTNEPNIKAIPLTNELRINKVDSISSPKSDTNISHVTKFTNKTSHNARDVIIYKCSNCETCSRRYSRMGHRCLIKALRTFCNICRLWYPSRRFSRHTDWHKKYKNLNILIENIKPDVICYNLKSKYFTNEFLARKKQATDKVKANDSHASSSEAANSADDLSDNDNLDADENPDEIVKHDITLYKCVNCKNCNFTNDLNHVCIFTRDYIKYCRLCQQSYTANNWKKHNEIHDIYDNINIVVKDFEPKKDDLNKSIEAGPNDETSLEESDKETSINHEFNNQNYMFRKRGKTKPKESTPNIQINESIEVYVCTKCNIHYTNRCTWKDHFKKNHKIIRLEDLKHCEYCRLRFPRITLMRHEAKCPLQHENGFIKIVMEDESEKIYNVSDVEIKTETDLSKDEIKSIDDTQEELNYLKAGNYSKNLKTYKNNRCCSSLRTEKDEVVETNKVVLNNEDDLFTSNKTIKDVDLGVNNIINDSTSKNNIVKEIDNNDITIEPAEDKVNSTNLHQVLKDTDSINNSTMIPGTKLYSCSMCEVYFVKAECCQAHIENHVKLDTKEYIQCKLCLLQFLIIDLHTHMVTQHSEEFNFDEVMIEELTPNESVTRVYKLKDKLQSLIISTTCLDSK